MNYRNKVLNEGEVREYWLAIRLMIRLAIKK